MRYPKLLVMLFAGLLSPFVGAAEVIPIDTPCLESKQLTELLNKSGARKVASELTQEKELVIIDSIWYNKEHIFALREFKKQGITCMLTIINHKPQL